LNDSSKSCDLLDLERDLPTTREDIKKLGELSNRLSKTSLVDVNRLLAPCWTMEKAMSAPLFSRDDEPFEL